MSAVGVKEHTYPPNLRRSVDLGQPERLASTAAGGLLLLLGLRNPSPARLLLGLVGLGLIYQGAAGRNVVESMRTGQPLLAEPNGLRVKKSVTVNRPQAELYEYWRNLENLPRFMSHVRSVQRHGAGRSHWVLAGPRGTVLKFDAQITVDRPNEMIGWQTLPGSAVHHRGYVKFLPAPGDRGTEVHIALEYEPPGGMAGKFLGNLLGALTEQQIQEEIRNFKRIMEAGDAPTTKGQPSGRTPDVQEQVNSLEVSYS
jgi:uncharacterized membrane protein